MKKTLTRAQRMARMLRALSGHSQREFGRETGVSNIGDIEDGSRNLSPRHLARMASIVGLTLADCEAMIRDFKARRESNPGRADGPGPERVAGLCRRAPEIEEIVDHYAARSADRRYGASRSSLRASEREQALESWQRLEPLETFEDMALVVRLSRDFQRWAVVELLCTESVRAAAKASDRAMLLARAALEVAKLLKVREGWRRRLQGFAMAHVANAFRVAGDFDEADRMFAVAWSLWSSGKDPEKLLDPGRLLELEASLRREQSRFADALALLKKAAAVTRRPEHAALNEAFTLEAMGDYAGSIAVLRRVAPLVEKHPETRLLTIQRFNLALVLTHVGRYRAAARLVPVIRRLAQEDDLDLIRCRWLEGRAVAGLGRTDKALEALEDARRAFAERNLHYEVALCFLEMAALHLDRGELDEVQRLAADLVPVFKARRIHRAALAALRLYAIAAKRQAATAGFTRDLLDYFFRARHDRTLRFRNRAGGAT